MTVDGLISLLATAAFVVGGIRFWWWWLQTDRQQPFLFWFGLTLGLWLLFPVPVISYFTLACGLTFFTTNPLHKLINALYVIWLTIEVIYIGLVFLVGGENLATMSRSYLIVVLPVNIFLLYLLYQVSHRPQPITHTYSTQVALLLISVVFYQLATLRYFSFVSVWGTLSVQIIAGSCLWLGLWLLAQTRLAKEGDQRHG